MNKKLLDELIDIIITYFLDSGDFNGITFDKLNKKMNLNKINLHKYLIELFNNNYIELYSYTTFVNPHIKFYSNINKSKFIDIINDINEVEKSCIYPTKFLMKKVEAKYLSDFNNKPYKKHLSLGYGQLEYQSFDMSILETYRNDPRYYYTCNDISGVIYIDSDNEENFTNEKDKIYLESFSFSYSNDFTKRYVAVFNRYLSSLSSEHQQLWKLKEVNLDKSKLNPVYLEHSIYGSFSDYISLTDAFLEELKLINEMSLLSKNKKLFRNTYNNEDLTEFSFLLKPTLKEYNDFIHLLDKLISENINKDFFVNDLELVQYKQINSNQFQEKTKGTLHLLEEWLDKFYKCENQSHIKEIIPILKKVRKLRQKPAHSINDNKFDNKYYKEQRELLINVYNSIRSIRLIFTNHPNVRKNPPYIGKSLFEGKILTY